MRLQILLRGFSSTPQTGFPRGDPVRLHGNTTTGLPIPLRNSSSNQILLREGRGDYPDGARRETRRYYQGPTPTPRSLSPPIYRPPPSYEESRRRRKLRRRQDGRVKYPASPYRTKPPGETSSDDEDEGRGGHEPRPQRRLPRGLRDRGERAPERRRPPVQEGEEDVDGVGALLDDLKLYQEPPGDPVEDSDSPGSRLTPAPPDLSRYDSTRLQVDAESSPPRTPRPAPTLVAECTPGRPSPQTGSGQQALGEPPSRPSRGHCRDPRTACLLIIKGSSNQVKCLRFRLKSWHHSLFSYISTTWQWVPSVGSNRIGRSRILVMCEDSAQMDRFLCTVKIPAGMTVEQCSMASV
uniref:Protein E8^E2C n=1 Tax=Mastomys natalensis papillomavirus (isolate African multimammate rat) TaxID=654915 RepID=VE8E2_MNPVA|nr:RecName: Full=Protein E8^E2C [Mastomys natalensis papillomavirus (isolate African multimammate rat)]